MGKYSQVIKQYQEAQERKTALEEEIKQLEAQQAELNAKAEEAAEKGNDEEYLRIKAEADRAGAIQHVRKATLQKADAPITLEEAAAAWRDYIAPVNKDFRKKYAEYLQRRKELCALFGELIGLQTAAFDTRQELYKMTTGRRYADANNADAHLAEFNMETLDGNSTLIDRKYFYQSGEIDMATYGVWNMAAITHTHGIIG